MTHPKTLTDFIDAARGLTPPTEIAVAYFNAAFATSPAVCAVNVFKILRDREDLDATALSVALGAAEAIKAGLYYEMAGEAAAFILLRAKDLPVTVNEISYSIEMLPKILE